ncbi:F-box associated domain, type 3 [Dillenia turbinata]|uniref:F-box associated domain, type 3 n=1 Tax=Dillenia turbinata TaxID=194707 RepID=A0AAN8Z559_9MAGN
MGSCDGLICVAESTELDPVYVCEKYKVVRTYVADHGEINIRFEILNLGEIVDSCLYWVLGGSLSDWQCYVLEFDLRSEKFEIYPIPTNLQVRMSTPVSVSWNLMNFGGLLTLAAVTSEDSLYSFSFMHLWHAERDTNQCLRVRYEGTYNVYLPWFGMCERYIVGMLDLDTFLLKIYPTSTNMPVLVLFFPKEGQFQYMDIPWLCKNCLAVCFEPSLLSPYAVSSAEFLDNHA